MIQAIILCGQKAKQGKVTKNYLKKVEWLAFHADVLIRLRQNERTNVRGVGTREEALGTSAWEASER